MLYISLVLISILRSTINEINKGMEFIDLHCIFKDESVIASVPNYFNNSETPNIFYNYSKSIRS